MNLPFFNVKTTYAGTLNKLNFEIARWGLERSDNHPPLNDGRGCWNYYLFLHERRLENFSDFWLEPIAQEFSPGGTKYLHCDYYSSPLSNIFWHGGVTYWEAHHSQLPGQRVIQIGCDYSHLADEGRDYSLSDIYHDLLRTATEIQPLLIFK